MPNAKLHATGCNAKLRHSRKNGIRQSTETTSGKMRNHKRDSPPTPSHNFNSRYNSGGWVASLIAPINRACQLLRDRIRLKISSPSRDAAVSLHRRVTTKTIINILVTTAGFQSIAEKVTRRKLAKSRVRRAKEISATRSR